MAAGTASDQDAWWESHRPRLDEPLPASSLDQPIEWPDPIEWEPAAAPVPPEPAPPATRPAAALPLPELVHSALLPPDPDVEAGPDLQAGPDLEADPVLEADLDLEADLEGASTGFEADPWSAALWGEDDDDLAPLAEAELYPEQPRLASPRGWHGAFAGRSTNTLMTGALGVVGVLLLGVLLVVRGGGDPTGSAQARPGSGVIVDESGLDPFPLNTARSPASLTTALAPTTTTVPPDPTPPPSPTPGTVARASTPSAPAPAPAPPAGGGAGSPATDPSVAGPPAPSPPATDPPATSPPSTSPPATSPPATSPPSTSPPATSPPATSPPSTSPATTVPPVTSTVPVPDITFPPTTQVSIPDFPEMPGVPRPPSRGGR